MIQGFRVFPVFHRYQVFGILVSIYHWFRENEGFEGFEGLKGLKGSKGSKNVECYYYYHGFRGYK